MDTNNNNNPLDPGLGSTPPTSDASSDAPVVAPDMGAPVSAPPAPDPLAVPAVDAPVAPSADVPAPDMGMPAPVTEVPAPEADMPPVAPANEAPVGFDPAIPAVETPVGDAQYNADLDAAKADFHTDMDNIEKKYDASAPVETAVPTPTTDAPTDGQS